MPVEEVRCAKKASGIERKKNKFGVEGPSGKERNKRKKVAKVTYNSSQIKSRESNVQFLSDQTDSFRKSLMKLSEIKFQSEIQKLFFHQPKKRVFFFF